MVLLLSIVVAGASACSDKLSPFGTNVCSAGVQLAATSSVNPSFSWTPDCHANRIRVTCAISDECDRRWEANTIFGNDLASPLDYGGDGPGVLTAFPAVELEVGRGYVVELWARYGLSELQLVATLQFTPAS